MKNYKKQINQFLDIATFVVMLASDVKAVGEAFKWINKRDWVHPKKWKNRNGSKNKSSAQGNTNHTNSHNPYPPYQS